MTTSRTPRPLLPTMYDLPSEEVGQPGLPDEYHLRQAQLLTETFHPGTHGPEQRFTASDMNLYYDPQNTGWNKRPDWLAVVGVRSLYHGHSLRRSYVLWDERVRPLVIVEFLSSSTMDEDLGTKVRKIGEPPTKWEAYARYVRVPYYIVFDGPTAQLQAFRPREGTFVRRRLVGGTVQIREVQLGLGIWTGEYVGVHRPWLRWCDAEGNWLPTFVEQERSLTEQERQRAEQERQRADQERQRAEQERQRAEQAELESDRLRQEVATLRAQLGRGDG